MNAKKLMLSLMGALIMLSAGIPALAHFEHKQDANSGQSSPGVVNINTATAEQLTLLPGIGPSRAQAIIQARERRAFRSVQELIRVRGIGRATLLRLRPYLTVEGETTLTRPVRLSRSE